MRSYLPDFDLRAPGSLADVFALLGSTSDTWRPFAGGTDLMVLLEAGRLPPGRYVGLWKVAELQGIRVDDAMVDIGAMTTYTDVAGHRVLHEEFPLLRRAALETGGIATQNRGTLGGNIANASPAADTPLALLVYDAELEIISARGTRRVAYDGFHLGYKQMDLARDELIARIRVPRGRHGWRQYYRKVGTRRAHAISKVCVAGAVDLDADGTVRDVRIAMGSVAPAPVRARAAEEALRGRRLTERVLREAQDALARDIAPIDDLRSTARYRAHVARELLKEFLEFKISNSK
jgi:CO/xanthine dehydrogenase FAD-binding subunit